MTLTIMLFALLAIFSFSGTLLYVSASLDSLLNNNMIEGDGYKLIPKIGVAFNRVPDVQVPLGDWIHTEIIVIDCISDTDVDTISGVIKDLRYSFNSSFQNLIRSYDHSANTTPPAFRDPSPLFNIMTELDNYLSSITGKVKAVSSLLVAGPQGTKDVVCPEPSRSTPQHGRRKRSLPSSTTGSTVNIHFHGGSAPMYNSHSTVHVQVINIANSSYIYLPGWDAMLNGTRYYYANTTSNGSSIVMTSTVRKSVIDARTADTTLTWHKNSSLGLHLKHNSTASEHQNPNQQHQAQSPSHHNLNRDVLTPTLPPVDPVLSASGSYLMPIRTMPVSEDLAMSDQDVQVIADKLNKLTSVARLGKDRRTNRLMNHIRTCMADKNYDAAWVILDSITLPDSSNVQTDNSRASNDHPTRVKFPMGSSAPPYRPHGSSGVQLNRRRSIHQRAKRSLLPFMGSIYKDLFGLATEEDINGISKALNISQEMFSTVTKEIQYVKDDYRSLVKQLNENLTSVIRDVRDQVSHIESYIKEMGQTLSLHAGKLNQQSVIISQDNLFSQCHVGLTQLLVKVQTLYSRLESWVQLIRSAAHSSDTHLLSRDLVTPVRLQSILSTVSQGLDKTVELLPVKDISAYYAAPICQVLATASVITVSISVPLRDTVRVQDVWVSASVPVYNKMESTTILLDHFAMIMNHDLGMWMGLSETEFDRCMSHPLHDCRVGGTWSKNPASSCTSCLFNGNCVLGAVCYIRTTVNAMLPGLTKAAHSVNLGFNKWLVSVDSRVNSLEWLCWTSTGQVQRTHEDVDAISVVSVSDQCSAVIGELILVPRRIVGRTSENIISSYKAIALKFVDANVSTEITVSNMTYLPVVKPKWRGANAFKSLTDAKIHTIKTRIGAHIEQSLEMDSEFNEKMSSLSNDLDQEIKKLKENQSGSWSFPSLFTLGSNITINLILIVWCAWLTCRGRGGVLSPIAVATRFGGGMAHTLKQLAEALEDESPSKEPQTRDRVEIMSSHLKSNGTVELSIPTMVSTSHSCVVNNTSFTLSNVNWAPLVIMMIPMVIGMLMCCVHIMVSNASFKRLIMNTRGYFPMNRCVIHHPGEIRLVGVFSMSLMSLCSNPIPLMLPIQICTIPGCIDDWVGPLNDHNEVFILKSSNRWIFSGIQMKLNWKALCLRIMSSPDIDVCESLPGVIQVKWTDIDALTDTSITPFWCCISVNHCDHLMIVGEMGSKILWKKGDKGSIDTEVV